jgi:NAD(P)-dependent dehydrogenase (short-subunit alcohol dehydrogenase family)
MTEQHMDGKLVLITGGTGGIGKQTAIGLARLGAHVVVNGRDPERGAQGVAEIKQASGSDAVELLLADMASQGQVRQLARAFSARHRRLDVLINNAGCAPDARRLTEDGLESAFAVNVAAPYLLTQLLQEQLAAVGPARVINLAGGIPFGRIDPQNLQAERSFGRFAVYSHTKRMMLALSLVFARRLEGSGISVNVAYPGQADTAILQSQTPEQMPAALRWVAPLLGRLVPRGEATVVKAARCSIFLASSPSITAQSGGFFKPNTQRGSWPAAARDRRNQQLIWDTLELATAQPQAQLSA